jgi:hypothetical protein
MQREPFSRAAWCALLALGVSLASVPGCHKREKGPMPPAAPSVTTAVAGHSASIRANDPPATASATLDAAAGITIGAPRVIANLTVFPVLAASQSDPGALTTLSAAMREHQVEVREHGGGANDRESATVNSLVLENKGKVPIYVLAGTIVEGGKQDRQVGQDFIVEPLATVAIDAFCVEHGRWDATRAGAATGGRFGSTGTLTTTRVRAAAQYDKDQGKVWNQVAAVNAAHGKKAATDTVAATTDDPEVKKRVATLGRAADELLRARDLPDEVVGFAYAIDGQLRGVRWFAHRRVFGLFRESLLEAAALDAITAQGTEPPKTPPPLSAADVTARMKRVEAEAAPVAAETAGSNVNEYKKSSSGARSSVHLKPKGAAAPPAASARPISVDYAY